MLNATLVAGCVAGGVALGAAIPDVVASVPATRSEGGTTATVRRRHLAPARTAHPRPRGLVARRPPVASVVERLLVAALTGMVFGLGAARIGAAPVLGADCVLFTGLVAVSLADLREGIVPRRVLYPTAVLLSVALVSAAASEGNWRAAGNAALGGVIAFACFFVLWWVYPRGLGFGDVRLAGVIGIGLGWIGLAEVYAGFVVAFVVGAVVGIVLMVRHGTGRKTRLPFAPALAIGAVVGVLWGPWIVAHWLHHA